MLSSQLETLLFSWCVLGSMFRDWEHLLFLSEAIGIGRIGFFCTGGDAMCAEIAQVTGHLVLRISELPARKTTSEPKQKATNQPHQTNPKPKTQTKPNKQKANFLAASNSCKSRESETRKEE